MAGQHPPKEHTLTSADDSFTFVQPDGSTVEVPYRAETATLAEIPPYTIDQQGRAWFATQGESGPSRRYLRNAAKPAVNTASLRYRVSAWFRRCDHCGARMSQPGCVPLGPYMLHPRI